ncbi:hypothetical protein AKO1_002351, partial [Acrasis kona]
MMLKGLISLFFFCLMANVFAGDIEFVQPQQQSALKISIARQIVPVRVITRGNTLSSTTNKSLKCPPTQEQKSSPVGGGSVRRPSNYFLAKGYKLAASCRIDCMSKVAGLVHFDGGCKQRFFYYANTAHCLLAGELTNEQAKLAEAYCMSCNGCIKRHNREFNAASA